MIIFGQMAPTPTAAESHRTSPDFPFHADRYRGVTLGTDEAKSRIDFGFLEIIG